jgi:Ca-activated chloride channel family protein
MKTLDANDPRLTAYALGELRGDEAAEIESAIRANAALAAQVQQIRGVASMLRGGFAAEHGPVLTEQQRQAIHQHPQPAAGRLVFRGRAIWISTGLAAAACLTMALFLTFSQPSRHFAKQEFAGLESQATRTEIAARELDEQLREREQTVLNDHRKAINAPDDANDKTYHLGAELKRTTEERVPIELGDIATGGGRGFAASEPNASPVSVPSPNGAVPPGARRIRTAPAPSQPQRPAAPASQSITDDPGASSPTAAKPRARIPQLTKEQAGQPRDRLAQDAARADADGENYPLIVENQFLKPTDEPYSTLSVDVDTASYSNIRRFITNGDLPPKDAVRIEEMINYFPYRYDPPSGEVPFSANIEVNQAPWNPTHRLVRIGLKGKEVKADMRPPTSLVFLIDVSGSMRDDNKLPLVKQSMKLLVNELNADDRLAIVTYAGNAGLVMDSTYCTHDKKPEVTQIIDGLSAGGSTNGAGGIHVAYDVATQHFIKDGVNRVILCTDGDFNVGVSSESDLTRLIEDKRATGVYLSILGFGSGNLQDAKMKQLSKHGNGNYAFIDTIEEGRKVLVDQLSGTLVPIARDVKVQVEFNPAKVGAYRLIGYEQRLMSAQDFNDDRKDAGEIGAGHTVTALFEVVPPGEQALAAAGPAVDDLKFQRKSQDAWEIIPSEDMLVVKVRFKPIGAGATDESIRLEFPVKDAGASLEKASSDFRFAAAVAAFGMILRDSEYKGRYDLPQVMDLAQSASDEFRMESAGEFLGLVERAKSLMKSTK